MPSNNRRRWLSTAAAGTAAHLIPVHEALAQQGPGGASAAHPTQMLKVIVATPAGGLADLYARLFAEYVTSRSGHPAIVENRPGASGIVAIEAMLKAPGDGHTVLVGTTGMFFQARVLNRKLPYDLEKDIAPIAICPTGPLAVAATEKSGIRHYRGMIETARRNRLNMGNYVKGSYQQILAENWNRDQGCKFDMVHYKGEVPMWVDMASGQLDVSIGSYQAFEKVRDKGLRLIGVTGKVRSPREPDMPTLTEQGFSGAVSRLEASIPIVASSAVPPALLDQLGRLAVECNDSTRARSMREAAGLRDLIQGREEALRVWREDGPVWIREVQALNLPQD